MVVRYHRAQVGGGGIAHKPSVSNAMTMSRGPLGVQDIADDMFTFNDQFYALFRTTVGDVGGYTDVVSSICSTIG